MLIYIIYLRGASSDVEWIEHSQETVGIVW